jgi:hypothetical protein
VSKCVVGPGPVGGGGALISRPVLVHRQAGFDPAPGAVEVERRLR